MTSECKFKTEGSQIDYIINKSTFCTKYRVPQKHLKLEAAC